MSCEININDLYGMLPQSIDRDNDLQGYGSKFLTWSQLSNSELNDFVELGTIIDNSHAPSFAQVEDYWSENGEIDFTKYPFCHVKVLKQKLANNYYCVYEELGGHSPELRCRLIQKRLIVL